MRIIFNEQFYDSTYSDDGAAAPGRMEAIMNVLRANNKCRFSDNQSAVYQDIARVHTEEYIETIAKKSPKLYEMAMLSAGGAIKAAELAMAGEPAFACIRPPGHHAYKSTGWGYCYFCNIAIALQKLRATERISSAFIIDFDAHTGDGTIDCLKDISEVIIFNPMADTREDYLKKVRQFVKDIQYVDIIAVSAGFDNYILDVGNKLLSFDFYQIGAELKLLSRRMGHNRRFAVLEGGYYQADLGKNVLSFCEGFM